MPDRFGLGAFPRLSEEQLTKFRALGQTREIEPGEVLFAEGEEGKSFFVIESGAVAIVEDYEGENRLIAVHGQHRFLGEIGLLFGQRLYLSGVVRDPGEVIEVPLEDLRRIVDEDKALSDLILGAFMARRQILIGIGTGIRVIGSRFTPDTRRLRVPGSQPGAVPLDRPPVGRVPVVPLWYRMHRPMFPERPRTWT